MGVAAGSSSLQSSARQLWLRPGYSYISSASNAWLDSARYSRCASADLDVPVHGTGSSGVVSPSLTQASVRQKRDGKRHCHTILIYLWAGIIGLAGVANFFKAWDSYIQSLSSVGLLVSCGFYVINADNLLALWSMVIDVSRLRRCVAFYKARMRKQWQKLRWLSQSDVALKEFDSRFDGSAIVARHDLPKLKEEVASTIRENASHVCALFIDPEPSHLVRAGHELGEAMRIFGTIFRNQFPDFNRRCVLLQQGLEASRRFHDDGGLNCDMLATLVGDALVQEDMHLIPRHVMQTLGQSDVERVQAAVESLEAQE